MAALVSSCVSVPMNTEAALAPLDRALAGDVSALHVAADNDDAEAMLAIGIVEQWGLHGRAPDLVSAVVWRERALTVRRTQPITQYTAAFNGQPSRVNIINVQTSVVPSGQTEALDRCIRLLTLSPEADAGACGSAESARRRQESWARASR